MDKKTGAFLESEFEKIRGRKHSSRQLWLMDDMLRRIIAFMPEKKDHHWEWLVGTETPYKLEWMIGLRPQYQPDFLSEKERTCLKYLFRERLYRFVMEVESHDNAFFVNHEALQEWALDQRRHLPAWLAWLKGLWYNRGKELWVYDDFDWLELDPRPLIRKIKEVKGKRAASNINIRVYNENCPDEYRV